MRYNTVHRFDPGLPYCPGTHCVNWDSPRPEWLTDRRTGNILGILLPRLSCSYAKQPTLLGYQRHS